MKRVSIRSRGDSTSAVEADDGRHTWSIDADPADGGDGQAPSPYELLLSALGACMAITARQYAARKGWPLAGVAIDLTHERLPARDATNGRIEVINASVRFDGALSTEQTARLLAIAQRCPVHRTLAAGARIVTTLSPIVAAAR